MSTAEKGTKTIDFWRWRHRPPGELRRTMFELTRDEAGAFPEARPLAEETAEEDAVSPEFADTMPEVGHLEPD